MRKKNQIPQDEKPRIQLSIKDMMKKFEKTEKEEKKEPEEESRVGRMTRVWNERSEKDREKDDEKDGEKVGGGKKETVGDIS